MDMNEKELKVAKELLDLVEKLEDEYTKAVKQFEKMKKLKLKQIIQLDKRLFNIRDELRICDMWVRRNHDFLKEISNQVRNKMRMAPRERD